MRNKIIIGCLLLGALSAKAQDTRLSAVEYHWGFTLMPVK